MKILKLIIFFISTINFEEAPFLYIHIYTLYVCYIYIYIYMCIYNINYICFLSPHVLQLSISNSLHFANVSFSKPNKSTSRFCKESIFKAPTRSNVKFWTKFGSGLLCVGTWANRGRRCLNWLSVLAYS